MRWLLASLILMLAEPASAASYMVGTWFGRGQPEDQESMNIAPVPGASSSRWTRSSKAIGRWPATCCLCAWTR